jgi:ArsR family transcriptional regulator
VETAALPFFHYYLCRSGSGEMEVNMSNMGNQLISNVFKALAHPTRIQIVKLLMDGEMCVCEILPNLDSEQSNTSQHLTVLKNQGILESRKDGAKVIYAIKNQEVCEMIELAEAMILRQIEETKTSLSK